MKLSKLEHLTDTDLCPKMVDKHATCGIPNKCT
jgi:hypothetical protein